MVDDGQHRAPSAHPFFGRHPGSGGHGIHCGMFGTGRSDAHAKPHSHGNAGTGGGGGGSDGNTGASGGSSGGVADTVPYTIAIANARYDGAVASAHGGATIRHP